MADAASRKTLIVTGAAGFIGRHLVELLTERYPQHQILGIGRRADALKKTPARNYDYRVCDLRDPASLRKRLPRTCDVLFHLAGDGRTAVPENEKTQQMATNVMTTAHLADYAARARVPLFLFTSSVYVYSGTRRIPFKEDGVALPTENLGASKIAAESLLKARALAGCFQAAAFRIFTTYGPGSRADQFIPQAIQKLRAPGRAARFGSSQVQRDFIYVKDVADGLAQGMSQRLKWPSWDVFNLGSGKPVRIEQMVLMLKTFLGSRHKVSYASHKAVSRGNHQADIRHSQSLLGWSPSTPLREGLLQTLFSVTADAARPRVKGRA